VFVVKRIFGAGDPRSLQWHTEQEAITQTNVFFMYVLHVKVSNSNLALWVEREAPGQREQNQVKACDVTESTCQSTDTSPTRASPPRERRFFFLLSSPDFKTSFGRMLKYYMSRKKHMSICPLLHHAHTKSNEGDNIKGKHRLHFFFLCSMSSQLGCTKMY